MVTERLIWSPSVPSLTPSFVCLTRDPRQTRVGRGRGPSLSGSCCAAFWTRSVATPTPSGGVARARAQARQPASGGGTAGYTLATMQPHTCAPRPESRETRCASARATPRGTRGSVTGHVSELQLARGGFRIWIRVFKILLIANI